MTHANKYHFIAILYYLGVCKLQSTKDYRHFHVQSNFEHYEGNVEEDEGGSDNEDHLEDYMEQYMERVCREEEYDHQDDSS
eukprot:15346474-Ditylum_brightwellii.AAC.1